MWQPFVYGGGAAGLATGIFGLFRPYFEFDAAARMILIRTVPGVRPRRFGGFVGSGVLQVSGRRIVYVMPNGRTRKVPVIRAMAEPAGRDAVVGELSGS